MLHEKSHFILACYIEIWLKFCTSTHEMQVASFWLKFVEMTFAFCSVPVSMTYGLPDSWYFKVNKTVFYCASFLLSENIIFTGNKYIFECLHTCDNDMLIKCYFCAYVLCDVALCCETIKLFWISIWIDASLHQSLPIMQYNPYIG